MKKCTSRSDSIKMYRRNTYIVLLLVTAYISVGQVLLKTDLHKDHENLLTTLFTGAPTLEVESNVLLLDVKSDAKKLEVHFTQGNLWPHVPPVLSAKDKKEVIPYKLTGNKDWFSIRANNSDSLSDSRVNVSLSPESNAGNRKVYFIKKVLLDGQEVHLTDFYYNYLDKNNSNVRLFYPADLRNLSKVLAIKAGKALTTIVVAILLVLFSTQLLLYFVSFVWEPPEVSSYFQAPDTQKPVSILDSIAEEYSIPLGFLGTVLSIWFALENGANEFSDFYGILQILKIAIFTTVLGLATKVICTVRRKQIKIFGNSSNDK